MRASVACIFVGGRVISEVCGRVSSGSSGYIVS